MNTATIQQFRDRATSLLKREKPIAVTKRGKIVGFSIPPLAKPPAGNQKRRVSTPADEIRPPMKDCVLTKDTSLRTSEKLEELVVDPSHVISALFGNKARRLFFGALIPSQYSNIRIHLLPLGDTSLS